MEVAQWMTEVAGPVAGVLAVGCVWLAWKLGIVESRLEKLNGEVLKAFCESIAADISIKAVLEGLASHVTTAGGTVSREVVTEVTKTREALASKIDHLRESIK